MGATRGAEDGLVLSGLEPQNPSVSLVQRSISSCTYVVQGRMRVLPLGPVGRRRESPSSADGLHGNGHRRLSSCCGSLCQQVSDFCLTSPPLFEVIEHFASQWGATWAAEHHSPDPSPLGDTLGGRFLFSLP